MAEILDFVSEEYPLSTEDILERAKEEYGILFDDDNMNITRHIQRYMKSKPYVMVKGKGKLHYHTWNDIEEYFNDVKTERHYRKISNKDISYATNKEVLFEQQEQLQVYKKERYRLLEKVGLTEEEGKFLDVDRYGLQEYVQADELEILKKKGMHLRSELSAEETETLKQYEYFQSESEREEQEIDRLFHQTKLEIMITALFNERFSLNEELLIKDIKNYVRGGEYSSIQNDDTKNNNVKEPSMAVRRSYLRFKKQKGYVQKKK